MAKKIVPGLWQRKWEFPGYFWKTISKTTQATIICVSFVRISLFWRLYSVRMLQTENASTPLCNTRQINSSLVSCELFQEHTDIVMWHLVLRFEKCKYFLVPKTHTGIEVSERQCKCLCSSEVHCFRVWFSHGLNLSFISCVV